MSPLQLHLYFLKLPGVLCGVTIGLFPPVQPVFSLYLKHHRIPTKRSNTRVPAYLDVG